MYWTPQPGDLVEWDELNSHLQRDRKWGLLIRALTIFDVPGDELDGYRGSMLYDVLVGDSIYRIDRYSLRKFNEFGCDV